jgi:hypothetical protein
MIAGKCFPYFTLIAQFPLTGGNILDEAIHPVSTFSFHLLGDVTVNVQCKGGGCIAQIALHHFNIVPALYRCNGVRVPLFLFH